MKVSFDFDATLSRPSIQLYAKELVQSGIEVWIVTSRYDSSKASNPEWNDDLEEIAKQLGIQNIHYTNRDDKYNFFKGKDFIWHLDDCNLECNWINQYTNTVGISCWGNTTWKSKCNKLLKSVS